MKVEKIYYNGKCVMTVDMDYVEKESEYECLNDCLGRFKERAFEEFKLENRYKTEIEKIWKGNEHLYELKNQVEQEVEGDPFEKVEQLFCIMKEKLNADEFELFKKLRNEETKSYNNFETNFYAGKGCLDYVWIEKNGKKDYMF